MVLDKIVTDDDLIDFLLDQYKQTGNHSFLVAANGLALYRRDCNFLNFCLDEQNKWISVEDRLPEELFRAVLIYCPENKNTYCAYLNARNEWHIFDQGSGLQVWEKVTHWMPLPAHPAEIVTKL